MGVTAQTLHGAKVCLIPKPENNYHPLALRRKALMAISGLILTAKIMVVGVTVLLPATAELSTITNSRILQLTNLKRIEHNLPALKENDKLSRAAAAKAKDIIENDYFAHVSPDGVTPWFWMQQENYAYTVAGENLAIDFVQAESVVDAWMASPGHKENLLHPDYTETGVAVHTGEFEGGTSTVVVHMFGLPRGATSPSTPSPLGARAPIITTPSPSPETTKQTPTPSPTPVPQNTAPSTPKLTLTSPNNVYTDKVNFAIFGDKNSTVKITVNNQYASTVTLNNGTSASYDLDISSFEDGKLFISAYAINNDNKTSNKSAPIEIHKDATGPTVEMDELSFLLSPGTDTPEAIMFLPAGKYDQLNINQSDQQLASVKYPMPEFISFPVNQQQLQINAYDEIGNAGNVGKFSLLPAIFTERDITTTSSNLHWINDISRRLLISVSLILLVLLTLAVVIRIKIQHPKMITHTTLVILLTLALLFI